MKAVLLRLAFVLLVTLLCGGALVQAADSPLQARLDFAPEETLPELPVSMRLSVTNNTTTPVALNFIAVQVTDGDGATRSEEVLSLPQNWEVWSGKYRVAPGQTFDMIGPIEMGFGGNGLFLSSGLELWLPGDYSVVVRVYMDDIEEPIVSNAARLRIRAPTGDDLSIWKEMNAAGLGFLAPGLIEHFSRTITKYPNSEYYRYVAPFARRYTIVRGAGLDQYATELMAAVDGLPGPWVDAARISIATQYYGIADGQYAIRKLDEAAAWSEKGRIYAQQLIDSPGSPHAVLVGRGIKARLLTRDEWQAKWDREHPRITPPSGDVPPGVDRLVVSPLEIHGGTAADVIVSLGAPAPSGGMTVDLTASDSAITLPAPVVVPAGAMTARGTLSAVPVIAETAVTITARGGGSTASVTIRVLPPRLDSIALSVGSVAGGSPATGKLSLDAPAPAGGVAVSLASSDPAVIVPSLVTIDASATTASFSVGTSAVATDANVTIAATAAGQTKAATLIVVAPVVVSLAFDPPAIVGGTASARGIVTLSGPVAEGGFTITLASDYREASIPHELMVAAGESRAIFPLETAMPVTSPIDVMVTANGGGTTARGTLTIMPPSTALASLTLAESAVIGGLPVTATVSLNNPAVPGGVLVALSSDDPATARVPQGVTIAAGSNSATFEVTTVTLLATAAVVLRAHVGNTEQAAALTVTPPPNAAVLSLNVAPDSVVGGSKATGTITLTAAAPKGGADVALTSSNPAIAAVRDRSHVAKGATSDTFAVNTKSVSSPAIVEMTASYGGLTQRTTFVVAPNTTTMVQSVAVAPQVIADGTAATGTITLSTPAAAGGAPVALHHSRPQAVSAPAVVVVPAGSTTAEFPIAVVHRRREHTARIRASYAGSSKKTVFTIAPRTVVSLDAVTVDVPSLAEGSRQTGTVSLTGTAPADGAKVFLSADPLKVKVPATVHVPGGASQQTFDVIARRGTAPANVRVTANYARSTRTVPVWIVPRTPVRIASIEFAPAAVAAGASTLARVTLSAPAPAGGADIAITCDNDDAIVDLPETISIDAGQSTQQFSLTAEDVTRATTAFVRASFAGSMAEASLNVTPAP
jgi:trimeric autotransporter adhesin